MGKRNYMRTNLPFCGRRLLIVAILASLLCGCKEVNTTRHPSLNESEIFFEETLSSISKDRIDENLYYVGTEDGIVYIYNSDDKHLEKITTDFDRIYKVVRDTVTEEPIYWVGTRNMGLFCCELKNKSFVMKERHGRFYIPLAEKATKYSAYDISIQDSDVYVATSHGLYKVDRVSNSDTLMILFPNSYKNRHDSIRPVVTSSVQLYNDKYLFCASDSGLLRLELSSDSIKTCIPEKNISHIVIRHDSIFSLSEDSVIITDINGERFIERVNDKDTVSFVLKQPAQIYYYDETTQINYFISNNSIQLVEDSNLYNSDRYKLVHTRRSIRTKCHNIMVNDLRHRQSLLVTIHSISRVGHHQDVFNSDGNVKLACTDNDNIYYLIDTKIYRQKKNEITAYPFKDITKGTKDIRYMEVLNDELYYVDSNHDIYKAKLYSNYFRNSILSWDRHIKQDPDQKKEVTAIGKDKHNVYVGVRDGFRNLSDIDKDIPLKNHLSDTIISDPFITKFFTDGEKTLLCTLNDGIFSGKDNSFTKIPGSNSYTFIRDLGIDLTRNNKICLLTNHGFYQQEDSAFNKIEDLSGYNKLLVIDSTHIYGVPNFGIKNLCDSMEYFVDIQFNPMACISVDNKIYAGSSNGVYVFSSNLSKEDGIIETAGTYYTIDFYEQDYFSRTNIFICIIILLSIFIGLWWYDRYKMSAHAIRMLKKGLGNRLDKLKLCYKWLSQETIEEIETNNKEVIEVDENGGKKSAEHLRNLSENIMLITSRVPSELRPSLNSQIKELKSYEPDEIVTEQIEQSEKVIDGSDFLKMVAQIGSNAVFLPKIHNICQFLDELRFITSSEPWSLQIESIVPIYPKEALSLTERSILKKSIMTSPAIMSELERVINQQIIVLTSIKMLGFNDELKLVLKDILSHIKSDYQMCLERIPQAVNPEEMLTEMKKVFVANQRMFIIQQLCGINKDIYDRFERLNNLKTKKPRDPDKIEEEEIKIEQSLPKLYKALRNYCSDFCRCIEMSPDKDLFEKLNIDLGNQSGKQLPLVICETVKNIKKGDYKYIIGGNEFRLSSERTKLKNMLEAGKAIIESYSKQEPSSIARYLVSCKIL